jgi:hypothetical protein
MRANITSFSKGHIPFNKKHGEAQKTKEYSAWSRLPGRCYNPKHKAYKNYGGRGITICDRWRYSYENFLADMGRAPSPKHSIDRIDNDGNYEPSNCRWATAKVQGNNQRKTKKVDFNGEKRTILELSLTSKIPRRKIYERVHYRGWSIEDAMSHPIGTIIKPKGVKGEKNGMSILNPKKVLEIRALKGIKSAHELGVAYGIKTPTVHSIWRRTCWKHI